MNDEIKAGISELENWLSDPHELGHKPSKIEYTNSFEDEDGINCMIYKYKKSVLGKWLLGIVSESVTFSEMKEYNKNTEIEDAKRFWKCSKITGKKWLSKRDNKSNLLNRQTNILESAE